MKRFVITAAVGVALGGGLFACDGAAARAVPIYQFCKSANCTDGKAPQGALVEDSSGNLYGSTHDGGQYQAGTVFELTKDAGTGRWRHRVLYSFCSDQSGCADGSGGSYPGSTLILDSAGNLYGTTCGGGSLSQGVAYELVHKARRWTFKLLADNFFYYGACPTGLTYAGAASGAPYDGSSPLFGTTQSGGVQNVGSIFRLSRKNRSWSVDQLYSFCSQSGCTDGESPNANVVADAYGHLFGTTEKGGAYEYGGGTVFEFDPGTAVETVLHSFDDGSGGCNLPTSPVTFTADGLLGATFSAPCVFSIGQNGQNFQPFQTTLPGVVYHAGLLADGDGNIFGVTNSGGTLGGGTLFSISRRGKLKVLVNFASGSNPTAGVIADSSGTLYGTVAGGGRFGGGWVYAYSPKSR